MQGVTRLLAVFDSCYLRTNNAPDSDEHVALLDLCLTSSSRSTYIGEQSVCGRSIKRLCTPVLASYNCYLHYGRDAL